MNYFIQLRYPPLKLDSLQAEFLAYNHNKVDSNGQAKVYRRTNYHSTGKRRGQVSDVDIYRTLKALNSGNFLNQGKTHEEINRGTQKLEIPGYPQCSATNLLEILSTPYIFTKKTTWRWSYVSAIKHQCLTWSQQNHPG